MRLSPTELRRRIESVFEGHGLTPADAQDVAAALVSTSARGVDTHGIRLLPTYLRELEGGRARARPRLSWRQPRPALGVLDADAALGIVAGLAGCRRAAELARSDGVGFVWVKNSNHFGAASVYTLELARRGFVAMAFSNADILMAGPGGVAPALGTNPLAVAIPAGEGELVSLDMATSQVSWSRIRSEWEAQGRLPAGWALDAEGRDCAEPGAGPPAVACTLGGYKGAGLGLVIELLCAGLLGARFGHEQSHLYAPPWDQPREVSHLFVAIDARALEPSAEGRMAQLLAWYRRRPRAEGSPTFVPGDLELGAEAEAEHGLVVEPEVAAALGIEHTQTDDERKLPA